MVCRRKNCRLNKTEVLFIHLDYVKLSDVVKGNSFPKEVALTSKVSTIDVKACIGPGGIRSPVIRQCFCQSQQTWREGFRTCFLWQNSKTLSMGGSFLIFLELVAVTFKYTLFT